jgi:hypothetical protein
MGYQSTINIDQRDLILLLLEFSPTAHEKQKTKHNTHTTIWIQQVVGDNSNNNNGTPGTPGFSE